MKPFTHTIFTSPSTTRTFFETVCRFATALLLVVLWMHTGTAVAQAPESPESPVSPGQPWLKRPWEIKYFIFISDSWDSTYRASTKSHEESPSSAYQDWAYIFHPTYTFHAKDKYPETYTTVAVEFDKEGFVKTPNDSPEPLRGRLTDYLKLMLATGDTNNERYHYVGEWFMGWGDQSAEWAPSLCFLQEIPNHLSDDDKFYKYGPAFVVDEHSATFGCREWAYQLRDPDRHYIDVTSYILPKTLDPDGPGAYVQDDIIGWFGFDTPIKPVIGKNKDDWYCFFACPGNDAPGLIPDIRAWASKNGWSVPEPPAKMPMFPDPTQSDMEDEDVCGSEEDDSVEEADIVSP